MYRVVIVFAVKTFGALAWAEGKFRAFNYIQHTLFQIWIWTMNKNIEKGEISIRYNLGRDRLFWRIGNEKNPGFLRVFY